VLAKVCVAAGTWTKVNAGIVAGHSYTLTLISHDDNYPGDATTRSTTTCRHSKRSRGTATIPFCGWWRSLHFIPWGRPGSAARLAYSRSADLLALETAFAWHWAWVAYDLDPQYQRQEPNPGS